MLYGCVLPVYPCWRRECSFCNTVSGEGMGLLALMPIEGSSDLCRVVKYIS
jgi:hypothetical protein